MLITFLIGIVAGGVQLGPLGTAATNRPIVPAPGDYDDGEIGGMFGRGNRSTRRKLAPVPLCPPQTPQAARTRTWVAAVGSQRPTAWATARPHRLLSHYYCSTYYVFCLLLSSCLAAAAKSVHSSSSVLTCLLVGDWLNWESELLYDWRFTAN
jgi:hypothetical protein